jgi:hypothetical protein
MDRTVTVGQSTKASDQNYSIKTVGDAVYTITDTDKFDLIDVAPATARTITLPTAADNTNRVIQIINTTGTDIVTVDGEGAETVNGASNTTLVSQYDYVTIVCDGTEWLILSAHRSYNTGWITRSDFTNVNMGSSTSKDADSNLNHNLNTSVENLAVKMFIGTSASFPASFELMYHIWVDSGSNNYGVDIIPVDNNNVKVQTTGSGVHYVNDVGASVTPTTGTDYEVYIEVQARE